MIRLQTIALTSAPTRDNALPTTLVPEMTLSFTLLKTTRMFVWFSGTFSNSNSNQGGTFQCVVDGVSDVEMQRTQKMGGGDNGFVVVMQKLLYLTPGTHTVAIYWAASANTLTAVGLERSLTVSEEEG